MEKEQGSIAEIFLPKGTTEWFEIISHTQDQGNLRIVLEEKNIPPVTENEKDKKIISKGFSEITITDFPIRGRRTLLTFKRRYWKIEGQKELLKRDISLMFPGTQLETEFANFLKEDGGRGTILAKFYRKVSKDPSERI
jgi:hypothetical protein